MEFKNINNIDNMMYEVNPKYIKLDEKMQLGYKYLYEDNYTDTIKTWLYVWNDLMDEMKKLSIKTFKEFDDVFNGTEFVSNWISDFDDSLSYVVSGPTDEEIISSYGNIRIQLNEQVLNYLEKDDELSIENAKRAIAETHFMIGNIDKGEELFEQYLKEDPQWGWGWIGWSDQYWLFKGELADFKRGEEILLKALSVTDIRDRVDVEGRLLELYSESEDKKKLKELENMIKSNKTAKGTKIGRNEPCPCGSGKKYKKCCGMKI
ncbi:MAG: SEC-C metal-binding domain-containing protein [Sedimentibacter sp.]